MLLPWSHFYTGVKGVTKRVTKGVIKGVTAQAGEFGHISLICKILQDLEPVPGGGGSMATAE